MSIEFASSYVTTNQNQLSNYDINELFVTRLIGSGVHILLLCREGRGRSERASRKLLSNGVLSVYLPGGFESLGKLDKNSETFIILNQFPQIAAILYPSEQRMFSRVISLLNITSFIEDEYLVVDQLT